VSDRSGATTKKHAAHAVLNKNDAEHAVFCGQCIEVVYKMYFKDPDNLPTPSWALPAGYNTNSASE
jgi:hypothetical protein